MKEDSRQETNERTRRYYIEHREKIKERNHRYKAEHYQERKERDRRYRIKHRQKINEYKRRHYIERRQKESERGRRYKAKLRAIVFNHYGMECACCGESRDEFLTIDHINNDGAQHKREIGKRLYNWLIRHNFPNGFQTLCWNCNCSKGQRGYCPHQGNGKPVGQKSMDIQPLQQRNQSRLMVQKRFL